MFELVARLVVVVAVLQLLGLAFVVGRERLLGAHEEWRRRLLEITPALVLLGLALFVNSHVRQVGPDVSWVIGYEITDTILAVEGEFVVWLQSFATPVTTTYFSYMYVYGYAFLLTFPFLAYLTLRDTRPARVLLWSYLFNYMLGLVVYLLIVAYGPRNILPHLVEGLLYTTFPEYQHLTRQVNRSTNVFPSLHTSLSMTVLFVAIYTRDTFGRWLPIASIFAISIVISTMFLAIHWASDVVAGIVLAAISVVLAIKLVEHDWRRLRTRVSRLREMNLPLASRSR